jgi:hypothetical protein
VGAKGDGREFKRRLPKCLALAAMGELDVFLKTSDNSPVG